MAEFLYYKFSTKKEEKRRRDYVSRISINNDKIFQLCHKNYMELFVLSECYTVIKLNCEESVCVYSGV